MPGQRAEQPADLAGLWGGKGYACLGAQVSYHTLRCRQLHLLSRKVQELVDDDGNGDEDGDDDGGGGGDDEDEYEDDVPVEIHLQHTMGPKGIYQILKRMHRAALFPDDDAEALQIGRARGKHNMVKVWSRLQYLSRYDVLHDMSLPFGFHFSSLVLQFETFSKSSGAGHYGWKLSLISKAQGPNFWCFDLVLVNFGTHRCWREVWGTSGLRPSVHSPEHFRAFGF